ncbi:site-specific integrase [Alkalicella caledoniensis]|uniref:Site-specific integrase n=1 Tax=Alkalicella caledoniensis TaxID=2731377 RepID=A0A7G9W8F8_ALKCA|nr:site-specific integrase [Alkalicella caledoniensis]QNO14970.1 site-specific integrase [Alkalicella caledoniensis]
MDYKVSYREKDKGIQCIINYKDQYGKWKQKSKQGFKRQKDAKPWIENTLEDIREIMRLSPSREYEGITFGSFKEVYIEHAKIHLQANTIKALETSLNKFTVLDPMDIRKIKKMDVQKIVDQLLKTSLKNNTIKLYVTYLGTVFSAAKNDYNLITNIPTQGIKLGDKVSFKTKSQLATSKALTDEELKLLLTDFSKSKYYDLIEFISKTGLRGGEALGVTLDDIDIVNCEIDINKQWKIIKETGKYGFGPLKSDRSYRKVPLPKSYAKELMSRKVVNFSKRLFPYPNTQDLQGSLNKAFKAKGYDITIHILRHTYITKLLASGLIDDETIAQIAGHTVTQLRKTYSHVNKNMRDKAKAIINDIV